MGESRKHIDLVKTTYEYIKTIVPYDSIPFIEMDSSETSKPSRVIGNFIPDVYYCYQNILVIGEAKTIGDFDRRHSIEQYSSYLQECERFPGKSVLVLGVPWQIMITAKNYFKRWKRNKETKTIIVIINEMGAVQII